jgi:hypothetical protein
MLIKIKITGINLIKKLILFYFIIGILFLYFDEIIIYK